jgi:dephospho-CoA kinase
VVACTGGIGAGKSTVAALLAARGAVVVDADALARAALDPGTPAYAAVVARFGPSVLGPTRPGGDGSAPAPIDRGRLAEVVFADPEALAALEAIVHPVVRRSTEAVLAAHVGSDDVVVLDLPLLRPRDGERPYGLDGVLVVDTPEEVALERLVAGRGMDPDDARSRMAVQGDRLARIRGADFVVRNLGTRAELEETVDRAWAWIEGLRRAPRERAAGEGHEHGEHAERGGPEAHGS